MERRELTGTLTSIYATFGKNPPPLPVVEAIWGRVSEIPMEALRWIADRICEEEKLPSNLALAIQRGWSAWKATNRNRLVAVKCPAGCAKGFWNVWRWDDTSRRMMHSLAPCSACRSQGGFTREELKKLGFAVMAPGYPGGPLAFDFDNGFFALTSASHLGATSEPQEKAMGPAVAKALSFLADTPGGKFHEDL